MGPPSLGGNSAEDPCSNPDPSGDGCGTIYKISAAGKLTTLYRFCAHYPCTDGDWPTSGLVEGADGNFYGTTRTGGYVWGELPRQQNPALLHWLWHGL